MAIYAKNKKAFHDYEILKDYEAGIVLNGDEVKSIKGNHAQLKGAFVDIINEEAFLNEAHVSKYAHSSRKDNDFTRKRKLILHKKEIIKIDKALNEKGVTAIPLELYSKKGLIKVKIGICRGKKLHDKRDSLKKRSQEMDIKRQLKNF
ncbi:SsrA-binding protein SmpB [Candidatus Peregrinibacteria bacterium]|jgi:SsrA-binding protein|nr:SsrA-binding protein SmpB [Candidatus Peregrinibacteria bacterium]